jgi:hypothetical protein
MGASLFDKFTHDPTSCRPDHKALDAAARGR